MINERFNIAYEQLNDFIKEQKNYADNAVQQFGERNSFAILVQTEIDLACKVAYALIEGGKVLEEKLGCYPDKKGRANAYVMRVAETLDGLQAHHKEVMGFQIESL
jgi:hypothetical protein